MIHEADSSVRFRRVCQSRLLRRRLSLSICLRRPSRDKHCSSILERTTLALRQSSLLRHFHHRHLVVPLLHETQCESSSSSSLHLRSSVLHRDVVCDLAIDHDHDAQASVNVRDVVTMSDADDDVDDDDVCATAIESESEIDHDASCCCCSTSAVHNDALMMEMLCLQQQ